MPSITISAPAQLQALSNRSRRGSLDAGWSGLIVIAALKKILYSPAHDLQIRIAPRRQQPLAITGGQMPRQRRAGVVEVLVGAVREIDRRRDDVPIGGTNQQI